MAPDQARAGIAHQRLDLLAPLRLVAVDRAPGTGGLAFLKGAPLQPPRGVVEQLLAFRAQSAMASVHATALADDHGFDRPLRVSQSPRGVPHDAPTSKPRPVPRRG